MANEVKYLADQGLTEDQCCDVMRELCLFANQGLYAQSYIDDVAWQNRFMTLKGKLEAIDSRVDSFKLIELAIRC